MDNIFLIRLNDILIFKKKNGERSRKIKHIKDVWKTFLSSGNCQPHFYKPIMVWILCTYFFYFLFYFFHFFVLFCFNKHLNQSVTLLHIDMYYLCDFKSVCQTCCLSDYKRLRVKCEIIFWLKIIDTLIIWFVHLRIYVCNCLCFSQMVSK